MNKKRQVLLILFFIFGLVIYFKLHQDNISNVEANEKSKDKLQESNEKIFDEFKEKYLKLNETSQKNHTSYFNSLKFSKSRINSDKAFGSEQDQTINIYSSYCDGEINRKMFNNYSLHITEFIPQYKKYFYSYIFKKRIKDFNQFIILLAQEFKNKNISVETLSEEIAMLIDRNEYQGNFELLKYLLPIIKEDVEKIPGDQTFLKLYLSLLFHGNAEFSEWQKTNNAFDSLKSKGINDRIKSIIYIVKSIELFHKNNIEISKELYLLGLKSSYELMHRMEPDGSLPTIYSFKDRINLREVLFKVTEIYDRDDFRFVSFGGWKNANALPPIELDMNIEGAKTFIVRNSWNILETFNERNGFNHENEILGDDQTQITIESTIGLISIYSKNYPQLMINLNKLNIEFKLTESSNSKTIISSNEINIEYDKKENKIQFYFKNPLDLNIYFYRSPILQKNDIYFSKHTQKSFDAIQSAEYAMTMFKLRGDSFLKFDNPKNVQIINDNDSKYFPDQLKALSQKSLLIEFKSIDVKSEK